MQTELVGKLFPCDKLQEGGGDFVQVVGVPKAPVHPVSSFHAERRCRGLGVHKLLGSM